MARTIICSDCGAERHNAQYKNTLYCHSCRLLRDLSFMGVEARRKCAECAGTFAPVDRRDGHCGPCQLGSVYSGECRFCGTSDAALHRQGVAVCVECLRAPKLRRNILAGLMKGQKLRRAERQEVAA